ncbi:hypothetical protein AAZX31_08G294500 [Glycine max]|uniref:Bifunctional inhibitor/plant lipid transfer protein/seed storage helical domain-containing protein n=1 Tax=Glycine max TaxID=3847 RepID=I1KXX3_SOYBN|nr:non-specific lipid-transfer protein AP10-like [Glycine soja]KAG5017411.1 hypothetical protein JHK85_023547 [Glycine max]KAG5001869.1 hypothetical protein JHK87_022941 [Glycine soja]KAG5027161.1 hypothetical protein JHK86_023075 [Glycine max]KAG5138296.1 hypothetical protein JHK82_023027 [Glycine max]KAH1053913.1 hypothetical protein GYH30_022918 [Glycine max]|eukprot:XP_025985225.1 non-specific lipid-transfer protein AP10-like [Glycine max]
MGEKKVLILIVFVMAYGLAATTFTASQLPPTCNGNEGLLTFCGPYCGNIQPNPTSDCCKSAASVFQRAMASGQGIRDLCNCLRAAVPFLNFKETKLISLPDACGIKLSFSMPLCVLGPGP